MDLWSLIHSSCGDSVESVTSLVGECVVEYVVECVVGSGQDSLPQVIQ